MQKVEKSLFLSSLMVLWDVSFCSGTPGAVSCQQLLWTDLNSGANVSGVGLCAKAIQLPG